jgi:Polyketide cyclase / dehydrase and lipid transport
MGHMEASRRLWIDPDALWAAVIDLPNWDKWLTLHQMWLKEPPAALTPGTTLVSQVVVLGVANRMTWQVSVVDSPSRLVVSGKGTKGVRCRFEIRITPAPHGSEFTMACDFHGEVMKGPLDSAVERDGTRQLGCALQRLDALAATA